MDLFICVKIFFRMWLYQPNMYVGKIKNVNEKYFGRYIIQPKHEAINLGISKTSSNYKLCILKGWNP
jgi:hypothetical protein